MNQTEGMAGTEAVSHGDENVERIRDILFGAQLRDYERRIGELEQRLSADMQRTRQELDQRIDKIEAYVREELERLADRQQAERKERLQGLTEVQNGLAALDARLQQGLDELEARSGQERLALRSELLDQSKQLNELIHGRAEELRAAMDQETRRLQADKTGRDELSQLMSELALRLSGDFQLPEA